MGFFGLLVAACNEYALFCTFSSPLISIASNIGVAGTP